MPTFDTFPFLKEKDTVDLQEEADRTGLIERDLIFDPPLLLGDPKVCFVTGFRAEHLRSRTD
jgi:hypothetical protein